MITCTGATPALIIGRSLEEAWIAGNARYAADMNSCGAEWTGLNIDENRNTSRRPSLLHSSHLQFQPDRVTRPLSRRSASGAMQRITPRTPASGSAVQEVADPAIYGAIDVGCGAAD